MNDIFLIFLKNDLINPLIGKIKILNEEPKIYIENCFIIKTTISRYKNSKNFNIRYNLIRYPLFTNVNNLIINSNNILTIVKPSIEVIKEYENASISK